MTTVADVDLSTWNRYPSSPRLRGSDPFGSNLISVGQAVESNLAQSIATGGLNTPFSITREASRTSGTAPLSVSFVAGFSASDATNTDFHDLYYLWDYGDTGSGTWGTNGKSRNADSGAIGAHVFESAGTHTVTLTVIDPLTGSTLDTDTFSITVTDADTTYSGTNTICVNNVDDTDFTAKPTGALEVNSDDLEAVMDTYFLTDKRVLFKRGGSWSYSTGDIVNSSARTRATIGAYGTGTNPDDQGLFDNAPLFTNTGTLDFFAYDRKQDCRLMDIEFANAGTLGDIIQGGQDINNNLFMNLKGSGGAMGVSMGNWRVNDTETLEDNFFVNNNFSNHNDYCFFGGGDYLCLLGNIFLNAGQSHATRVWHMYKSRISHNQCGGASHDTTLGRHALKLHPPGEDAIGTFAETGNGGLPNGTAFVCVSDNEFGSSAPWPVVIAPQTANNVDERLVDIVFERNKYSSDLGIFVTGEIVTSPFRFSCRYTTVRNNVIHVLAEHTSSFSGININQRSIEPTPAYIYIYNNTVVTDDDGAVYAFSAVEFTSDSDNCIARNNLLYAPNVTTEDVVIDSGTDNISSNNLDSLTTPLVDPFNATPSLRDYSLSGGSGAVNTGISVTVYDDITGAQRTGTFDVGSYKD